jgi:hypothetical protein
MKTTRRRQHRILRVRREGDDAVGLAATSADAGELARLDQAHPPAQRPPTAIRT